MWSPVWWTVWPYAAPGPWETICSYAMTYASCWRMGLRMLLMMKSRLGGPFTRLSIIEMDTFLLPFQRCCCPYLRARHGPFTWRGLQCLSAYQYGTGVLGVRHILSKMLLSPYMFATLLLGRQLRYIAGPLWVSMYWFILEVCIFYILLKRLWEPGLRVLYTR